MKKTLIALAALAATGASFAQVTITGNLTSGYSQASTNAYTGILTRDAVAIGVVTVLGQNAAARTVRQNSASGFGVDNAEIMFTAKEDIGGGQSVQAELGLENVARGVTNLGFGAADTKLTYTNTSFGRIQYGNTRGAATFRGLPSAGAPVVDMDGKLFENRSVGEYLQYAVPVGPITIVYQYNEGGAGTQNQFGGVTGSGIGLGQGTSGAPANVRQRNNMLLAGYKDGPLEGFVVYKGYDNGNADAALAGTVQLTKKSQWSLQGSYDLGMAKVGFGYAKTDLDTGIVETDMLVGLNVPMGALEVGATFGSAQVSGLRDAVASKYGAGAVGIALKALMQEAEGTATGWSIGAKYNLSKRTSFKANYAAWTRSGYAQFESVGTSGLGVFGNSDIETQANLLLSHSF